MKIFYLNRKEDISGVSGLGRVAEGIEFDDGRIVLNWCLSSSNHGLAHAGLAIYDRIEDCIQVHGHNGATEVEWIETQGLPSRN